MKITFHGKHQEEKETESFKCPVCGCRFECEKDEYYVDNNYFKNGITISTCTTKRLVCSCPECHKIVEKEKTDPNYYAIPTVNLSSTANSVTKLDINDDRNVVK